ncbi:MAG: 30S ribosomal protein S6 [Candidatus Sumerlaeaceae bacterium]|nr:30S ribosomal protein S6 [Candidatus Sumerlaeaceae bacterium]
MPNYELVLLFDPYLEDEAYSALLERTKDLITKRGGEVTNVDVWGRRRLAYPIAKKVEAYYAVVSFSGKLPEAGLSEITRALRLNERVVRVMLTRLPDLAKKEEKAKKTKAAQAGEVSSGEANTTNA